MYNNVVYLKYINVNGLYGCGWINYLFVVNTYNICFLKKYQLYNKLIIIGICKCG